MPQTPDYDSSHVLENAFEMWLTTMIESEFCDNGKGKNTRHNITALLRQSITVMLSTELSNESYI